MPASLYSFLRGALILFCIINASCKENQSLPVFSLNQNAEHYLGEGDLNKSAYFYSLLTDSLYSVKNYERAAEIFIKTTELYLELAKFSTIDSLFTKFNITFIENNDLLADVYSIKGKRYLEAYEPASAEKYFLKSYSILLAAPSDTLKLFISGNNLLSVYIALNKFNDARVWLDKNEIIITSIIDNNKSAAADFYLAKGSLLYKLGNYPEALSFYSRALSFLSGDDNKGIAKALNAKGNAYYRLFEPDSALSCFKQALDLREKLYGPEHPLTADIHNNLGLIYDYFSEPEIAAGHHNKALTIRERFFGKNNKITARSYTNLANALKDMDDFQSAERLYTSSIQIFESYDSLDPDIAVTAINLGEVLSKQFKYQKAVHTFKIADKILTKHYGSNHLWVAITNLNLSIALNAYGETNSALHYLKKAEKIASLQKMKNNVILAIIYSEMGSIDHNRGKLKNALLYYQKSLSCFSPDLKENDYQINPDQSVLSNDIRLANVLTLKANALLELGEKYSDLAYETIMLASGILDNIRLGFREESSALLMGKGSRDTYAAAMNICYYLYSRNQDRKYLEEAFRISEKSKSSALLNQVIEARAKSHAGIPDSLLNYERSLKSRINSFQNLDNKDNNRIFTLKQEYLNLLELYEKRFPSYYNLKYNVKTITTNEVRRNLLKQGQTMIEYFYTGNDLYIIAINTREIVFKRVRTSDLDSLVSFYRSSLLESRFNDYSSTAYQLYRILISPVKGYLQNSIIVIPDGTLNMISFDTLIDEEPGSGPADYNRLKYLIYKYDISYNYSGTLLKENINFNSKAEMNKILGLAPY
jgi:tetratricopeptide (TPR) repeat protein